jgi:putative addiction module component (TIGR02574 family)
MVSNFDEIIGAALSLPASERAMLANHLLESLGAPDQGAIDNMWAAEAEKRVTQLKLNQVQAIPAEEVFQQLRSRSR